MENSQTSMNKAPSSTNNGKTTEDSPEESSWTFYMQDFLVGDHDDHHDNYSSSFSYESSPSLVSDAFSSAAARKDPPDDNIEAAVFITSARSNCKNLSFKKRKAKATAVLNDHHHDLEDTASSPANSPKVSYINQLNHNPNDEDKIDFEEANICRNIIRTAGVGGAAEEENNNNQSELKKRGLCLVPVSMLSNYFG
ncbi:hypothetical protein ACH5RR_037904 [Cinchona calisaya]|uniref:Uncharacterized protein n=1 Tax=Cinchona calisaya TaxID=153742 RepID=A0ABD2YC91_9GENT